jgi:hypothetical protein
MENWKPRGAEKPENRDASIEGNKLNRTALAAAMFLGAIATDPAMAEEKGGTKFENPTMQQQVDPTTILKDFAKSVADDLRAKGIDKQLQGAALGILQTLAGEGAKTLYQLNKDLSKLNDRGKVEKEKRP